MRPEEDKDALARLNSTARAGALPRIRISIGAAVVLAIAALVIAVIVSVVGQQSHQTQVPRNGTTTAPAPMGERPGTQATPGDGIIFVHVLGAVRRPGLFELRHTARVMDAVAAAGGLTETADPGGVNLARLVTDGEQLYVPQLGEAQPGAPPGAPPDGAPNADAGIAGGTILDLNAATVAELDTLPRIGPALAQRIVDYREAHGRFSSVDDLRNVTGIGEKTFDGLKDLVRV